MANLEKHIENIRKFGIPVIDHNNNSIQILIGKANNHENVNPFVTYLLLMYFQVVQVLNLPMLVKLLTIPLPILNYYMILMNQLK